MSIEAEKFIPEATIRRALEEFRVSLEDRQVNYIQKYIAILRHWNEKLNLTAIRNPLEILYRHFCESMYAAVAVPVQEGRLADVGSGPGFPGIPMKILRPGLELFLVESNIKKGAFLAEVIRELGLASTHVLINRYEELGEELAPLDFVCSRALGGFGPFLEWAASDSVAASRTILWVGGRDICEIRKSVQWEWQEPITMPQSLQRFLLIGQKKCPSVGVTTS